MRNFTSRRRLLGLMSGLSFGLLAPNVASVTTAGAAPDITSIAPLATTADGNPIAVSVTSGVAIGARSTSGTPGDHVAVLNLAKDGGTNNAALNIISANTAFSAAEIGGHETAHGTLKIGHVNPSTTDAQADADAAALSIDLRAGAAPGTAAQGIFVKSTTGGTTGKIIHYQDSTGVTIFALLPDGSLLLRPLASPPTGTKEGLKLCNVGGTLGVVDATGTFTRLT
jgi:hypothetical protein